MNIPLILLIVASLADIYTSRRFLKKGYPELNRIVTKLFGRQPAVGEMLAVKATSVAALIYVGSPTGMLIGAAAFGAAAVWNARL